MNLPVEMSDSTSVNAFDVWFDNIFTDMMVQDEIKSKLSDLNRFRKKILDLISDLDMEIESLER